MRDIADAAELSKGSLYLQFSRKEEIILALILRSLDGLERLIEAEAAKPGSARERLERLAWAYEAYAIENHDARDYIRQASGFQRGSGSAYRRVLRERIDRLYGMAAAIFAEGSKDGSLRPDVEAAKVARLFTVGMGLLGERAFKLCPAGSPVSAAEEEALSGGFIELFMYFISGGYQHAQPRR